MRTISEKIKHDFKKFPEVEIVILFGSAIKDQLIRQSDIDLIDLHQVNGHILKNILCEGDTLIKKSIPLFAFFLKKMWYNQADMMPKTRMILEKQVNEFINR